MRRLWTAGAAVLVCLALGTVTAAAQSPSASAAASATARSPAPSGVARAPVPSQGCGRSTAHAGTTYAAMGIAGQSRSWLLHVPAAHDGRTPLPLVIQLHGYGSNAPDLAGYTGFDALGDAMGFVTVTPNGRGTIQRWIFELDARSWQVTPSHPDVVFIGALIDRLGGELCLDLARVYVTGISNGGFASTALACVLGDRIAAIAPVAAMFDYGDTCRGTRRVPILALIGKADPILPFEGGLSATVRELPTDAGVLLGSTASAVDPMLAVPIPQRAAGIAARYGCAPEPTVEHIAAHVDRIAYSCPANADVVLVVLLDGGHTWPSVRLSAAEQDPSDHTNTEVDASRMMWDFFVQHPLPAE
jgi:polyhydroxybutyrate depolymerase